MTPTTRSRKRTTSDQGEDIAIANVTAQSPSSRKAKKRKDDVDPEQPATAPEPTSNAMSEEEMALYDRQIRLWGLEAQTKMRTSRILIAGICGLSNEICKNIVLAGVGKVTLLDAHLVVERDLGAQFFLTAEDVGKNIAEAAAPRITNLNPRVHLNTISKDVGSMPNEFFKDFDLVLVAGKVPFATLVRINNICREQRIKFISCAVFGTNGYMFSDLLEYEYVEERNQTTDGVTTVKRTKKSETYCSLETARATKFNGMKPKLLKRISPVYFGLQILWDFEDAHKRLPAPDSKEDLESMLALRSEYISASGGDVKVMNALITPDVVRSLAQEAQLELSPVCAIVGGIVSQDVLNIVSAKEVDVCNFFCFGDTVGGVVKALGAASS
ncbi:hypothetical protein HDU79_006031 [Rhizoclosmatium sp. JEL0117]|nr:hypothetical protein HDU79_006031 [Rhizoclosmatium sp. JEL0117]